MAPSLFQRTVVPTAIRTVSGVKRKSDILTLTTCPPGGGLLPPPEPVGPEPPQATASTSTTDSFGIRISPPQDCNASPSLSNHFRHFPQSSARSRNRRPRDRRSASRKAVAVG